MFTYFNSFATGAAFFPYLSNWRFPAWHTTFQNLCWPLFALVQYNSKQTRSGPRFTSTRICHDLNFSLGPAGRIAQSYPVETIPQCNPLLSNIAQHEYGFDFATQLEAFLPLLWICVIPRLIQMFLRLIDQHKYLSDPLANTNIPLPVNDDPGKAGTKMPDDQNLQWRFYSRCLLKQNLNLFNPRCLMVKQHNSLWSKIVQLN